MNQTPAWFERKFEFTFPVEVYPNLWARLRGTPARLEELAHTVAADVLIKRTGQKWSAQEHIGHLLDLEPLGIIRVVDYVTGASELTPADLKNRKTDEATYNLRSLEQILRDFRAARSELMKRLESVEPGIFARSLVHPRLKQPMRLVDYMYFVAEHDDHHLASIWELVNA